MKSKFLALFLLAASPVLAGAHFVFGFGVGSPYYRGYGYYRPPVVAYVPPVYAAPYAYGPAYYGPGYYGAYGAGVYGAPPFAGAVWFGPRYYGGRYYRGYWGHRR